MVNLPSLKVMIPFKKEGNVFLQPEKYTKNLRIVQFLCTLLVICIVDRIKLCDTRWSL